MPISSMYHSVLMHEPVNCVYNPSAAKWCAISHVLSQDFCWDPLKLSFCRHGIGIVVQIYHEKVIVCT